MIAVRRTSREPALHEHWAATMGLSDVENDGQLYRGDLNGSNVATANPAADSDGLEEIGTDKTALEETFIRFRAERDTVQARFRTRLATLSFTLLVCSTLPPVIAGASEDAFFAKGRYTPKVIFVNTLSATLQTLGVIALATSAIDITGVAKNRPRLTTFTAMCFSSFWTESILWDGRYWLTPSVLLTIFSASGSDPICWVLATLATASPYVCARIINYWNLAIPMWVLGTLVVVARPPRKSLENAYAVVGPIGLVTVIDIMIFAFSFHVLDPGAYDLVLSIDRDYVCTRAPLRRPACDNITFAEEVDAQGTAAIPIGLFSFALSSALFIFCVKKYITSKTQTGRAIATSTAMLDIWASKMLVWAVPSLCAAVVVGNRMMVVEFVATVTFEGIPIWVARANRTEVVGVLMRMFESRQRLRDGAFIATLFSIVDSQDEQMNQQNHQQIQNLMQKGCGMLRSISFENLSVDLLSQSAGGQETYALSNPCRYGSIDFFISHSWQDDGAQKYAALSAVANKFEAERGRKPTFWYASKRLKACDPRASSDQCYQFAHTLCDFANVVSTGWTSAVSIRAILTNPSSVSLCSRWLATVCWCYVARRTRHDCGASGNCTRSSPCHPTWRVCRSAKFVSVPLSSRYDCLTLGIVVCSLK